MTSKAEFNAEEWDQISEGPALAGLIVIASQRGGTIRETFALAKVYSETAKSHPSGDLIADLVSAAPHLDAKQFSSKEDLRTSGLQKITEAVSLVEAKATPEELADYRTFAMTIAEHVAERRGRRARFGRRRWRSGGPSRRRRRSSSRRDHIRARTPSASSPPRSRS
jgi:hypothetical protein